jgi:radical SAM protein with 4Fe4S-binding SPASM domain
MQVLFLWKIALTLSGNGDCCPAFEMSPLPGDIQIEPVGHCARRWTRSAAGLRDEGPQYSAPALYRYDAFCRLVDQLPRGSALQLRGIGEPLLHPRFFDMVAYAAGRGMRVSTESDLPALSERRADECVASGLRSLRVRVKSPGDAALVRLQRLAAAKRRAGTPWPVVTVFTANSAEFAQIAQRASAAGAEAVEFAGGEPPQARCDLPWRKAFISVHGDAKPCGMPVPHEAKLGNVHREGLEHVWNGAALREFRDALGSGQPPAICRGCAAYGGN